MILYQKPSDLKWYKADCLTLEKSGTANVSYLRMALNGATANQPVALLAPKNTFTFGGTGSQGRIYYLSPTATTGAIAPVADLSNGNYLTPLGYLPTTTTMYFDPYPTGVVLA
jgi:hypothetical protein